MTGKICREPARLAVCRSFSFRTIASSLETLRRLFRALPETSEAPCHGTPGFYVKKKLIARVQEDAELVSLAFAREDRDELIERYPDVFSITPHFENYDYVLLNLLAINDRLLAEMVEGAWLRRAGKRLSADYLASQPRGIPS